MNRVGLILQSIFNPKEVDICPTCGATCLPTDVLCPECGKNLDELYKQLRPDWTPRKRLLGLGHQSTFLVLWLLGSAIGMAVGQVFLFRFVIEALSWFQPPLSFELPLSLLAFDLTWRVANGIATWTGVGFLQWLALRYFRPTLHGWFWLSELGVVGADVLEWLLFTAATRYLSPSQLEAISRAGDLTILLVGGLALGLCQWLALRRSLKQAWLWLVTTAVAWTMTWRAVGVILDLFAPRDPFGGIMMDYAPTNQAIFIAYSCAGLVLGIITGTTLLRLVKRSPPEEQQQVGIAPMPAPSS